MAGAQEGADQDPAWLVRPNEEMFSLFYPPHAVIQDVVGRVDLHCTVRLDQRADCAASLEEPDGWGFADAAVAMSRSFRLSPAVRGGRPVEAAMRVPIRFTQTEDKAGPVSGPDLPTWEDAPSADAVRAVWSQRGHGEGVRARGVLSCRVNQDRTLVCAIAHETMAGAGAAALALAPEFKVHASDASFISRYRDEPFILPVNFGFGLALEPVSIITSGLAPVDVTAPSEVVARFYPEAARRTGVTGSATVLCTATAARSLDCTLQSETPEGHGLGAAAEELATSLSGFLGVLVDLDWPFLDGDQVRILVPFRGSP
jgi:hypothetical protein